MDANALEEMRRARIVSREIPIDIALELLDPAQTYLGRYWKDTYWHMQPRGMLDRIHTGRPTWTEWVERICEPAIQTDG
jgi:hypothetical protein